MVHCGTFAEATLLRIARFEFRNIAAASEHRLGISLRFCVFDDTIEIRPNTSISSKIAIDHLFRVPKRNIERLRQTIRLLAVDDAEVNSLCATTQQRRHLFEWHIENAACCLSMKIFTGEKCVNEMLVTRKMREQTKFDLRVVCRKEQLPFFERHEAFTDLTPEISAYGDVLQVRIG